MRRRTPVQRRPLQARLGQLGFVWAVSEQRFEALLKQLYWTSAVVHLETELNGTHTFRWETDSGSHSPQQSDLRMRCAWERESGLFG